MSAADPNAPDVAAEAAEAPRRKPLYLLYVMGLLLLINIVNFLDRQAPFILAPAIKKDLHLSDTQLALFGGLAFSMVYPVLGIPLARLADRYGSKWVLGGSLLVWSALTAFGGLAANFGQLFVARLGVAAGEAGSTPAAHALIAANYPLKQRGMPLAVFSLGVPLGSMIALMVGGLLLEHASWRLAFFYLGAPGLVLAVLAMLTVREPKRTAAATASAASLWGAIVPLLRKPTFRQMAIGIGVYSMGANAMIVFTPTFLLRSHTLGPAQVGLWLGLIYGISGVAGTLAGGGFSDRLGSVDRRWRLWAPAAALAIAAPFTLAAWLVPGSFLSLLFLAVPKFSNLVYIAPIFTVLQTLVPANARASASALLLFFNSLIGLAFGPLIVGALSDALTPMLGADALRWALCFVPLTQVWAAVHFTLAARSLERDLHAGGAG